MSIFNDIIDAVSPTESQDDRDEARREARALSDGGDWLSAILDHHEQVEQAFAAVKAAAPGERPAALKALGTLLNGHAIAEEAAIYPAMADTDQKGHAKHAYTEQATVKIEMAKLEKIDPATSEFLDKLETIEQAVAHHVYEEEKTWFPKLKDSASLADQGMMTERYREEFERYAGEPRAFGF